MPRPLAPPVLSNGLAPFLSQLPLCEPADRAPPGWTWAGISGSSLNKRVGLNCQVLWKIELLTQYGQGRGFCPVGSLVHYSASLALWVGTGPGRVTWKSLPGFPITCAAREEVLVRWGRQRPAETPSLSQLKSPSGSGILLFFQWNAINIIFVFIFVYITTLRKKKREGVLLQPSKVCFPTLY